MDDPHTYEMLGTGYTLGVFQLDSTGMQALVRKLRPTRFEDISALLDEIIDEIFSVDRIRRYKPHPDVYDMVTTQWRLYPEAVSFQSSNRWDVAGAAKFGYRTIWINRTGMPDEYPGQPAKLVLPSLDGVLTAG